MEDSTVSYCRIPLTGKHANGKFALVDSKDVFEVSKFKWLLTHLGRAKKGTTGPGRKSIQIFLHRFILDAPKDMVVDHINGDPLDNRRCNLRVCTRHQNAMNQKKRKTQVGFKGVRKRVYGKLKNKITWEARIKVDYKEICIGYFKIAEDAAKAYDIAARHYFGEYANTNFPT
jgi:HNH endonuclease